jgi:hypothetical protein
MVDTLQGTKRKHGYWCVFLKIFKRAWLLWSLMPVRSLSFEYYLRHGRPLHAVSVFYKQLKNSEITQDDKFKALLAVYDLAIDNFANQSIARWFAILFYNNICLMLVLCENMFKCWSAVSWTCWCKRFGA